MKIHVQLLLALSLTLSALSTGAQTQVNHPSGTVNYGGTNVTVTATGAGAQIYGNWCGAGDYWIGASSQAGSFTFDFSPNVTGVIFEFTAMNFDEVLSVSVNGQPYSLGDCNLTDFPGTCGTYNTVVTNGQVTCPVDVSFGANGTITVCGNLQSVTLANIGAGNGTVFSTYFMTGPCNLGGGGSVTAGSNSPLCQGETLNLTATAGGITYSWTGPNGFTSNQQNPTIPNITSNMSGDYIVTSSGACGVASDTVSVQVTPGPVINGMNSNSPLCEGQTLSLITSQVTNGVYNWTGPNGFTSNVQLPTIPNVTTAASGDYILTVSVNNCVSDPDTINVVVDPLPPLPGVADVDYCQDDVAVPLTATGNNLNWYLVPSGGTPIPGGAPTPNTTIPGTTTYYVASTGPGPTFCEGPRAAIVVTVYVHPNPPNITYKNSYCSSDVFEPFVVVNGQNILYYTQAVGGVGDPAQPVVDVTAPGTYQWYATQTVNGCESDRFPITIVVHPYIESNFMYNILWGCTEDSVQFTNTSIGGFGYQWSFGDFYTDTAMNPLHIYDTQGVYTVQLISTAPYCRDTFEQTIDLNHPLSASFTTDFDTICQHSTINFTNTSVTTTINSIPPTFSWSFGDGGTDPFNQSTSHTYDNAGVFIAQMIVTDFVPCKDTAWKFIVVDSISGLELVANDSSLCAGEAATFTGTYHDDGLLGVTWDYGDGLFEYDANPARHTYEQPGTYNIKISTDYRLCRDTSAELQVIIKPYPLMSLGADTSMCPTSEPLVLNDLINAGNPNAKWLWNTGETTFNIVVKQPGYYSARVEVDGCGTSDTVWVKKDCYIDVPNVFTPDGDNLNDYFLPRQWLSRGVVNFTMSVYNRWGQEVYTTKQIDGRGWDGKFNGVDQPQGVYVYVIEATFKNGVAEKKQGNVTLLR